MFESLKERNYNLRELCREADVTERTVRYYIKEGLLPPPHGSGPFSRYGYEHWLRLAFIKRLKDEYLPLSEIKNLLDSRSTAELDQLARQNGIIPAGSGGGVSRSQAASPVLPGASSGANGGSGTVSNSADTLQGLLGGVQGGRARMLREQIGLLPAAGGLSYGAAPAQSSAPRARSVAESAASMTPMPAQEPDFYEAPLVAPSAFMSEPDANFEIDTFADVPGAASMSMAFPEPDAVKEMISADDKLETDEVTLPPPAPAPSYNAPSAYRASLPPQSFMAGSAAPVQGPMPAPEKPSASMPVSGFNRSAQVPASPAVAPHRAMRMSRIAAPEFRRNEVAFDSDAVNSDFGADIVSENIPLEPLAEKIVLPEPSASMKMMARMAPAAMPVPVSLAPMPESADETVTGQTWERIEVAPGVELHIEKRIADTHRPALANLVQAARRLFGPKEI